MENYKTLRRYIVENLDNLGYGDDFLDIIPKEKIVKEKKKLAELH